MHAKKPPTQRHRRYVLKDSSVGVGRPRVRTVPNLTPPNLRKVAADSCFLYHYLLQKKTTKSNCAVP
ncbi:unnamed protein product [Larinioides sclopetarius]|uniref:Uncharacterized protein n=1 Tax=Larinioides sclopetarius TaxID=280406 RepID=A0AAV2BY41_9ARAC